MNPGGPQMYTLEFVYQELDFEGFSTVNWDDALSWSLGSE